jgi:hypothetical protein
MLCWHKWGMWSAPKTVDIVISGCVSPYREVFTGQERTCTKCGRLQYRQVEWK